MKTLDILLDEAIKAHAANKAKEQSATPAFVPSRIALVDLVPNSEYMALKYALRGEEREGIRELINRNEEQAGHVPGLRMQDALGDQSIVWLHYFHGGADWWITELDRKNWEAFGFCDLGFGEGEWGYVEIEDLKENGVELDLHWTPRTWEEIKQEKGL